MLLSRGFLVPVVLCCLISITVGDEEGKADKGKEIQNCGQTNASSTRNMSNIRTIQTREAEKGAWPWMAEIYITKRNEKQPVCGGVLVSHSYVVTAAHCVVRRGEKLSVSDVSIRLGDHDLESDKDGMNSTNVNVTVIHPHEGYDSTTYANDIALLHLERPVTFNKHIQPICLPSDSLSDEDLASRNAYIAGWGSTTFGGPTSNVLIEMTAVIVDDEFCRDAYKEMTIITDENICTVGINGSGPCMGFGGAPVMFPGKDNRYYLVGIVSYGRGCGDPNYPDVNTKVTEYLNWLATHMT